MKKLTYKIRKGTKSLILGLSILGVLGYASLHTAEAKKAMPSLAFIGIVATMKKNKKWDDLDSDTKSFMETQDELLKKEFEGYVALNKLDEKLKEFAEKSEEKGLSKEEMAEFKEMVTAYKDIAQKQKKLEDEGIGGRKAHPLMLALKEGKGVKTGTYADFAGKKVRDIELEVKATEQASDIATHTIGVRVPGIGQLPTRKPFIMDLFRVVPVNTEYVKYMDQETIVRDAKNVYGIDTTTHNTKVTWKERQIQIMKVRDFVYTSVDMLNDYDFVMGEIQALLESSVMLKVDDQLLNGDGASPNFHSIDEYSAEFDASNTMGSTIAALAGTVQAPNVFDLCIAMASHISALGKNNNYRPDTILWNSLDAFRSMLVKDKNDNYILPPFVNRVNDNEYTMHGMRIISNPNVPANSIYMFDSSKGTIYMRKGFGIEMAYNNGTDFEIEQVTTKAYVRLNFFVRNVDTNAFMKCSDVETALAALKAV